MKSGISRPSWQSIVEARAREAIAFIPQGPQYSVIKDYASRIARLPTAAAGRGERSGHKLQPCGEAGFGSHSDCAS